MPHMSLGSHPPPGAFRRSWNQSRCEYKLATLLLLAFCLHDSKAPSPTPTWPAYRGCTLQARPTRYRRQSSAGTFQTTGYGSKHSSLSRIFRGSPNLNPGLFDSPLIYFTVQNAHSLTSWRSNCHERTGVAVALDFFRDKALAVRMHRPILISISGVRYPFPGHSPTSVQLAGKRSLRRLEFIHACCACLGRQGAVNAGRGIGSLSGC